MATEEERLRKHNEDPDYIALSQLADSMHQRGSHQKAIDIYELQFKYLDETFEWDTCELYRKMGDCYYDMGDKDKARIYADKTLNYSTTNASIYQRLAELYYSFDQDKGIEMNERAFELDNNFSNYGGRNFLSIKTDAYTQRQVKEKLEEYASVWPPKFVANGTVYTHPKPKPEDKHKKLKIAYVSSDFYNHTMMSFIIPLISHHDTEKYEIILYSTVDRDFDDISRKIMRMGNRFVDCRHLNNFDFAKMIYEDNVDIVIDLGGFTHNRAFALLFKPAPIQAQYMGFLNTYGFKEFDYILCDEYTIPKERADEYTETPLYIEAGMDRFRFTREEDIVLPEIPPLPYDKNGYITFGSYNDLSKITTTTIRIWSKLLKKVPNSKMLIYRYGPQMTPDKIEQLKTRFESFGIDRDRLEFSQEIPDVHFKAYATCDFAVDPTPFGGLSITIEALHMGIPTLTMPGEGMQGRGTGRINRMLGIDEDFNGEGEEGFAEKGAAMAANIDKLRKYRFSLREQVQNSPLKQDLDGFARSVEAAYERAWEKYVDDAQKN